MTFQWLWSWPLLLSMLFCPLELNSCLATLALCKRSKASPTLVPRAFNLASPNRDRCSYHLGASLLRGYLCHHFQAVLSASADAFPFLDGSRSPRCSGTLKPVLYPDRDICKGQSAPSRLCIIMGSSHWVHHAWQVLAIGSVQGWEPIFGLYGSFTWHVPFLQLCSLLKKKLYSLTLT